MGLFDLFAHKNLEQMAKVIKATKKITLFEDLENIQENTIEQSQASQTKKQTYTSTQFKVGDLVKFNSMANTYYDAKSGAKIPISSKEKSTVWKVTQFDVSSNKIVHLMSLSDNNIKIKAKISDLVISDSANQSSNSESKQSGNSLFQSGDIVKFKSTANVCYDYKSGAKLNITSTFRDAEWYVDHMDAYSNNKFVFLTSKRGLLGIIKARISDLIISDSVNQPTNSVTNTAGKEKNMVHYDNYNGYQFTALGLSGSGKTCFMAGMYYKMTGGVSGYTLKADDDDSVSLTAYYEQMTNAQIGADRFPGGTNQSTDYSFELQYGYKTLEKFRWVDYAGGTLKSKNNGDAEEYQQLKNDIAKSEVLYIFVDGGLFVDDDVAFASSDSEKIELLTDIVMDNCSRQINHFLSEYTSERKKLPPIAIIVTKYDLAVKALGKADNSENMEMLYKVIQRAFNLLFPGPSMYTGDEGHTSMVGIIPVSLGSKISENNYTGKLRPINMHMPAYVGIWFMLKSKNNQDTSVKKLSDEIEDSGIKFWLDGKTGKFSTLAEGYLKKIKEEK